MIEYATFLRALAAILITNSHYNGVYPIEILASGGLLGDVLFFALSGFVLVNVRGSFVKWYQKRLIRIYPSIWIITLVYIIMGFYTFDGWSVIEYFLYPTYYHFIASIVVLYIPYYLIARNNSLRNRIPLIMVVILIFQFVIYQYFYNKTYYHIDVVREPMIRFLFFQSMLLGLYFRIYHSKYVNRKKVSNWVLLLLSLIVYFATKLAFVKIEEISQFQIVSQIALFIVLYYIFKCFASIDDKLVKMSYIIRTGVAFVAKITLQIYAVQYAIIPIFEDILFPFNWIVITSLIIISAYILYFVSNRVSSVIQKVVDNFFRKRNKSGV